MTPNILGALLEILVVILVIILLSRISYYLRHILAELRKDDAPTDLRVKCSECGNAIPRAAIQYLHNQPVCAICHAQKAPAASATK